MPSFEDETPSSCEEQIERLKLSIKSAGIGTWNWDIKKDHITWDDGMYVMFGLTPGKFKGTYDDFNKLVHPHDRAMVLKEIQTVFQTGEVKDITFRIFPADGSPIRFIQGRGRLYKNKKGEPVSMAGVCWDVTKEKSYINTQLLLSDIVASSEEAMFRKDLNGIVQSWNAAAERFYGYTPEEMIGQSILKIIPEHKIDEYHTFTEGLIEGKPVLHLDTERRHKSGKIIPVSVTLSLIRNHAGELVGVSSVSRDITEQKKVEKLKNEFISTVSHELRTPLTSIQGSLSLLYSNTVGVLPNKALQLISIAKQNCERLVRLINDILDLQKIESGKMEFHIQPIEINNLLENAVETNQSYAEGYGIKLELKKLKSTVIIYSDFDRLIQVLSNLISNAVKFSPANSVVKIQAEQIENIVRVSVSDKGPGIPKAFQSKIFGRFMQAEASSSRGMGGSGLGLNISKGIIDKLGGKINFITSKNEGTVFYFDIATYDPATYEKGTAKSYYKTLNVLICENDKSKAESIAKTLEKDPRYKITIAQSAADVKLQIKKDPVDALILDLVLPDQDGLSLIKDIYQIRENKFLPIIAITVDVEKSKADINGKAFTVVDWIEAPFAADRLLGSVESLSKVIDKNTLNVLHVEDDEDLAIVTANLLQEQVNVTSVATMKDGKRELTNKHYDLVILDLVLPDGSGLSLLPIISKKRIPVIVFTAYELPEHYASFILKYMVKSKSNSYEELLDYIKHELQTNISKDRVCKVES